LDAELPQTADPDERDRVARLHVGLTQGAVRGECGVGQRRGRNRVQVLEGETVVRRGDAEVLGVPAVVADAEPVGEGAELVVTPRAGRTVTTPPAAEDGDLGTGLEVDAPAGLDDRAGDLVAQHPWLDEWEVSVHHVQVGVTDPTGRHLDEHRPGPDGRPVD